MITAHELIKTKDIQLEDFEQPTAYLFYQGQWVAWRLPSTTSQSRKGINGSLAGSESPQMKRFHDKMKSLGCEDIFYRWIELVQFESSGPGGMKEKGKERALKELDTLLTEKGVETNKFLEEMGGSKNLPGMDDG